MNNDHWSHKSIQLIKAILTSLRQRLLTTPNNCQIPSAFKLDFFPPKAADQRIVTERT